MTELNNASGLGRHAGLCGHRRSAPGRTPMAFVNSRAPTRAPVAGSAPAALSRDPMARLAALFDAETADVSPAAGNSGVLAATGRIDGAMAVGFACDPRVQGGALGAEGCAVIVQAYREAVARGVPVVGLWHSGGARLGGPEPHSRYSGVVHLVAESEVGALAKARRLAALLSDQGKVSDDPQDRDLSALLPDSPRRAYDVRPLVSELLDEPGLELHPKWAPNIVTILGRFARRTVGVVASNPLRLGGCLDATSADKAARFVRMCDAFGVPLVVLVDVPGYLPGVGQEWGGVVRRGAKLLHAFAEATVPRVTLVTRKAYGGAFIAMNSRSLGATRVFAWPRAEVAVMGAVAAVRILHRRALSEVDPGRVREVEAELAEQHEKTAAGLRRALDLGVVDEIIEPARTRQAIARAIADAPQAVGAHTNIPL